MGPTDVKVRRILAVVFLLAAAALGLLGSTGAWISAGALAVLAVVFLVTSQLRTCPLYMPFGFSTRKE